MGRNGAGLCVAPPSSAQGVKMYTPAVANLVPQNKYFFRVGCSVFLAPRLVPGRRGRRRPSLTPLKYFWVNYLK